MEYYSTYFGDIAAVLTVQEALELLCIGRNTIYALLKSGKLKGFRAGKALDEYVGGKSEDILTRLGVRGTMM